MGMLPPVVATLVADTKEYSAKMDEATGKMAALGKEAQKSGSAFGTYMGKASTAVIGLGAALGAYAVDKAFKFQEGLDALQNQAGLTASQANKLGDAILHISSTTGATTTDLMAAGLAVEQAGVRGARAQQLLTDAAKASVITGQSVVDTSKSIVSVEQLQIAKGMSLANVTGLLVAGAQHTVGGMTALAGVLQGRVGVALANTGMKMKDIVTVGAEFSTVGLQSRAAATFATALAKLDGPLTTTHITTKKTYTTLSTYALALKAVGLSQSQLASTMRTGGLPALLNELKDAAAGSAPKLQELLQVVFGSTGAASANLLVEHLKQIAKVQTQISGAGAGSLQTGFTSAIHQLGPQFKLLMAQVDVLMVEAGKKLLPALGDVAHFGVEVIDYFKHHPLLSEIAGHAAMDVFAAALTYKIAMGLKKAMGAVRGLFSATEVAANTEQTAANTAALEANTAALGGEATTGGGAAVVARGGMGMMSKAGLIAGGTLAVGALADYLDHKFQPWFAQMMGGAQTAGGRHITVGPRGLPIESGGGRSGPVRVHVTHRTKYGG